MPDYRALFHRSAIHCHAGPRPEVHFPEIFALRDWRTVPPAEKDVIKIGASGAAVSFQEILRTGENRTHALREHKTQDQSIDFDQCDSFTSTMDGLRSLVYYEVENSLSLQALLKKESWTREDRVAWEREVSQIVSDEMHKVPGLASYRLTAGEGGPAETRPTALNLLARDIEGNTQSVRFCCEEMALVEGCLLQQADNHFLPPALPARFLMLTGEAPGDDFKRATNYFYAASKISVSGGPGQNEVPGGHAFIISSGTGNIIEATNEPGNERGPYRVSARNYSFEDFTKGKFFVEERLDLETSAVYGSLSRSADVPRARLLAMVERAQESTARFSAGLSGVPDRFPAMRDVMAAVETQAIVGEDPDLKDMAQDIIEELKPELRDVQRLGDRMRSDWDNAVLYAVNSGDNQLKGIVRLKMHESLSGIVGQEDIQNLPLNTTLRPEISYLQDWFGYESNRLNSSYIHTLGGPSPALAPAGP